MNLNYSSLEVNLENKDNETDDLAKFKLQLDEEFKEKVDDIEAENKYQLAQETLKLDTEKDKILEEYEEILKKEFDKELETMQRNFEAALSNEDREFELQKLKIEQQYEQDLERSKNEVKHKYEQQLEDIEVEKARKVMEIEKSLKELALTNDKPELAKKLQNALNEQKELETKIDKINRSIEEQKRKCREITFETNKIIIEREKHDKADKTIKIKDLQYQIQKVDEDIANAEHEYQKLLEETKNINKDEIEEDIEDSDLNERVPFDDTLGHPKPDKSLNKANNISLEKLANDISEIKNLIEETGVVKTKVKDYLLDVEEHRERAKNKSIIQNSLYLQRDELKQEKQKLKREQQDIEKEKK